MSSNTNADINTTASPPLPDPKRFITDNSPGGQSFFSAALAPSLPVLNDLGGALTRLAYLSPRPPAPLTNGTDLKSYQSSLTSPPPLVPPGGGPVVWYIDTPPASASPMHRTVSLDIVVQLEGELELTLGDGETRVIRPGDLTVQRSTMHAWRNPSTTRWSRMLAVMLECQPVVVEGGRALGAEFPGH